MNQAVQDMLNRYELTDIHSRENALKEIMQEIALLGLWRAKFFEKAAFYGGSALRILYGLDRFSEDLDFSLLIPDRKFDLSNYHRAVKEELNSYGFDVEITKKEKKSSSLVQSAFIKSNTQKYIYNIGAERQKMKIKFEVDTDPPPGFKVETKYLLQPTEFFIKAFSLPDLFAGKLHALLYRKWQVRVKGRDWYDLIWFIKNQYPLSLRHLEQRIKQTESDKQGLNYEKLLALIADKIHHTDFMRAKEDVLPFIKNPERLAIWSKEFFWEITRQIRCTTTSKPR